MGVVLENLLVEGVVMQKSALGILLVVELLLVSIDVVAMDREPQGCPCSFSPFRAVGAAWRAVGAAWNKNAVAQQCGNFLNNPELLDTNAKLKKALKDAGDVGILGRFLVHQGDPSPRRTLLMEHVFADKGEFGHFCTIGQVDTLIAAARVENVLGDMLLVTDECNHTVLDLALYVRCPRIFCKILQAAVDAGVLDALVTQSIQRRGRHNFLTFVITDWRGALTPNMTNLDVAWIVLSIVARRLRPEHLQELKQALLRFMQTNYIDPVVRPTIETINNLFSLNK